MALSIKTRDRRAGCLESEPPPSPTHLAPVIHWNLVPRAVLSRVQLTKYATRRRPHISLRDWCKQSVSAWSVKTRRALSRHRRDARVYRHATTAMHDMSAPLASIGQTHSLSEFGHCGKNIPRKIPVVLSLTSKVELSSSSNSSAFGGWL